MENLRVVTAESIKIGDILVSRHGDECTLLAGPDCAGFYAGKAHADGRFYIYNLAHNGNYHIKPLFVLEDTAIYAGDKVWCQGERYEVISSADNDSAILRNGGRRWLRDLTLKPQKQSGEGWGGTSKEGLIYINASRDAVAMRSVDRIFKIKWEEVEE